MIRIASPMIGGSEKRAVMKVLSSGKFIQGENVEEFENKFAKYIGTKFGIAVCNGTAALHTALLSVGIKSGDEVIVPSFSFISSANAILYCNAKPVFADINPKTFNVNPESIKNLITERTKAIIVVHLYGQPCDMAKIKEVAEDNNLLLVEDAAQAHGAEFEKKKVGTFGNAGIFSFYPTKNMTTSEGGIVVTNDESVAEKARKIRNIGQERKYYHTELGYNYRMTEIEAAIGLEQLKKLEVWIKKRIENARVLTKLLEGITGIIPPFVDKRSRHIFHQYTVRINKYFSKTRDELVKELLRKDVETSIHYPLPIHKQPLYIKLGYKDSLPETESASKEVLSLPVHPRLSKKEISFVAESIKEISK